MLNVQLPLWGLWEGVVLGSGRACKQHQHGGRPFNSETIGIHFNHELHYLGAT